MQAVPDTSQRLAAAEVMLTRYGKENERLVAINEALVSRRAFVDSDYTSEPLLQKNCLHLMPGGTLVCEALTIREDLLVCMCHSLHHRINHTAPHHRRRMTGCKCGAAPLQAPWMRWTG